MQLLCEFCAETRSNLQNLKHHLCKVEWVRIEWDKKNKVSENVCNIKCETCDELILKIMKMTHVRSNNHKNNVYRSISDDGNIKIIENAFKSQTD